MYFWILCLLVCAVLAGTAPAPETLIYENRNDGTGNYKFRFVISDGTKREEIGTVMRNGQLDQYIFVRGYYMYKDPTGTQRAVYYEADDKGYRVLKRHMKPDTHRNIQAGVVASLLG